MSTAADQQYMRRALQLAKQGDGRVQPNPMVGCVITKAGSVIGEGYHRRFGGPHAEIDALPRCTTTPRGATVYVTLEPCCYHGQTPPCTDALIAARVARVVASVKDPSPRVAGRGLTKLRRAGIRVDVGLLSDEARALNAPFFKLVRTKRPWVILKWAQSLDGKIAARTGDSKWITDETCRKHVHRTRGRIDAIIIGVGTVLSDNPLLTCRAGRPRRLATRIIIDTKLRTPPASQLVQTADQPPTWIFHGPDAPRLRARALENAGCVLHRVPTTARGVSLPAVLNTLGKRQMTNVLVEGGSALLGSFFDQKLADEYHVYIAPILIGGAAAPGPLGALGADKVAHALRLSSPSTNSRPRLRPLGDGYLLQARAQT